MDQKIYTRVFDTVYRVMQAFADKMRHELRERLPLEDVLYVKNKTEVNLAEVRKYINAELSRIGVSDAIEEYKNKRFGSMKWE